MTKNGMVSLMGEGDTPSLDLGDGLRIVDAEFQGEQRFNWEMFRGYDTLRVLTYSASVPAIVRLLDEFEFAEFEVVFGSEKVIGSFYDIIGFQNIVMSETRAAIKELPDERHARIIRKAQEGKARFLVLRQSKSHAKIYLLSNRNCGPRRVITGSANLSEVGLSGDQYETLTKYDDDPRAWDYYSRMYESVRAQAHDNVPLPQHRIEEAEIRIDQTPALDPKSGTLVIEPAQPSPGAVRLENIEKLVGIIKPRISPSLPSARNGKQTISPDNKRKVVRLLKIKEVSEAEHTWFSINRHERTAMLSGKSFALDAVDQKVKNDVKLLLRYFQNYENAFRGNIGRMQRDYFVLWAWLYFSPFMCDIRELATDKIRNPLFAIIHGKPQCGKTTLVRTLMVSMFGMAHMVNKQDFTGQNLRNLQYNYKRFPVVFDDISQKAFRNHAMDMIKNENEVPGLAEYPVFLLSMNADAKHFPPELIRRVLSVYTTTSLPLHDEALRQRLDSEVQDIQDGLTGHLYRRFLQEAMNRLDDERGQEDWLSLATGALQSIITESIDSPDTPTWCERTTWVEFANKRYDRPRARLRNLFDESTRAKRVGENPIGWMVEDCRITYWEPTDSFGRGKFNWNDMPAELIDEDASSPGRTVLNLDEVEQFLGAPSPFETGWQRRWPFFKSRNRGSAEAQ